MIEINDEVTIDDAELDFAASRSAGPGGQNVNKVETRMTLRFDLEASTSLSPEHKERIRERLSTRISKAGVLAVSSQRHRTQAANRDAARERFVELVREALEEEAQRRPTRTPRRVHKRRLEGKRRRGRLKQNRSRDFTGED
ncbi:MAG TPA: alternative ribosome rescue aminoacyl-tRNA hydrolase ArfB [Thermoanaerobaculia bacterium]